MMDAVAPLVGAWIEILTCCVSLSSSVSLLSWERGLKSLHHTFSLPLFRRSSRGSVDWNYSYRTYQVFLALVAPLVGAWIEITYIVIPDKQAWVAPLVGAWIEIHMRDLCTVSQRSLLSWERGLKSWNPHYSHRQWGRSSRGSVDWNLSRAPPLIPR